MSNFLNLTIPNRIFRVYQDKNPNYIRELIDKHQFNDDKFDIKLHYQRQEIEITGYMSDICELFQYFDRFGLSCLSVTQNKLTYNIDDFLRKIY